MDFSRFKKKFILSASILLLALAAISISYFRLLDVYELETLDVRFRLRPPLPVDKNIAIIEIGDDTIDAIGKWPIARSYHAELVKILTGIGAKAIVFDVFFSEESDGKSDEKFEEAIRESGKVYLPYVFNIAEKASRDIPAADRLQEELIDRFKRFAKGTGFINIIPDKDGKFRRVPPLVNYRGKLYPHVSLLLCADYLGLSVESIAVEPRRYVKLADRLKAPLDLHSTLIVNFPGYWKDTFRHYSFIDIIDSYVSSAFPEATGRKPTIDLESLKGSVCFVGVTATATPDAHPTPFDSLYPGVGVHASLFNSFLINKFIKRAGPFTNVAILFFLCLVTCFISSRTRTLSGFLFVFLFIAGYAVFATLIFFIFGLWLDIFCPITVVLFIYLGVTFAKYISEVHKIEILEKELSIAKKIQESFLPKESPEIQGLDIAGSTSAARHVGGDLYDFLKIDDKKIGIMIGDVSGKGVPAALFMAKVVSEFKTYARGDLASGTIFELNKALCSEGTSGLFVTLSYAVFNTDTRLVNYSAGGHLPMIMIRRNPIAEVKLIDSKEGMPLGLFEGSFDEEKVEFKKGDTFVLYTDGVTEAMNPRGDMFGRERLIELAKKSGNLSAKELIDLIQKEVKIFEGRKQHDDITVVAVRVV